PSRSTLFPYTTLFRFGSQWGEHHHPDQRCGRNLLIQPGTHCEVGNQSGHAETGSHVVVDRQHVTPESLIDGSRAAQSADTGTLADRKSTSLHSSHSQT